MNEAALPSWVVKHDCLPTLPNDVSHLVRALADESLDEKALGDILAVHPTMVSHLLALANSTWAAAGEQVASIEQVCATLTANAVRSVSIGLAVMKPFNPASCPAFDLQRYWSTAMLVAQAAVELAEQTPAGRLDVAFPQTMRTVGIMHNIGLICIANHKPQELQAAFALKQNRPEFELRRLLYEMLQIDYCEIGAYLAASCGVPAALVAGIRKHRDLAYRGTDFEYALLAGAAVRWVGSLFKRQPLEPWPALAEEGLVTLGGQAAVIAGLQQRFPEVRQAAAVMFR